MRLVLAKWNQDWKSWKEETQKEIEEKVKIIHNSVQAPSLSEGQILLQWLIVLNLFWKGKKKKKEELKYALDLPSRKFWKTGND